MQSEKNHVRHCLPYEFRLGRIAADVFRNLRSVPGEDGPFDALADIGSKLNQNGQEFRNEAEVKSVMKTFFDSLPLSFFVTAFSNLAKRWKYRAV